MIPFISNLFNLSVTRKEVLERAKRYKSYGLCYAIDIALSDYYIDVRLSKIEQMFPLFRIENAVQFGANTRIPWYYWWKIGVWSTGRMDFLNWLIEQYKNDKTNLRKL